MVELNKIIQGDCLEVMKEIPDNSVDLVLTDPPYELDWRQSMNFKNKKSMLHHKAETQKWDKGVKELYPALFKEFDRIVKRSGSVLMFTRSEFITYAIEAARENNFDSKSTIVWHKTNPIPQLRKRNYVSAIEMIIWVARYDKKKAPYTFNFKSQKEMRNFIEVPICTGKERTEHPTQKPERLIEHLMEIHSNEGDTVLDPFVGSGTTAFVAKKLGRNFIGIELDQKYFAIARKRIDSVEYLNFKEKI